VKIRENEKNYMVVATDGLWEVLKMIDVLKILKLNYFKTAEELAEMLKEEAYSRWKQNEKIVDDITVIVYI
jgi:serine/threonine protein phosphatase PrpC